MKRGRIDSPLSPAAHHSSSAPLPLDVCGSDHTIHTNTDTHSSTSNSNSNNNSSSSSNAAAITVAGVLQRVEKRGSNGNVVVNSPYGSSRAHYGWGDLFHPPRTAHIAGYSNIHIGISSLNGVPGKDRRMPTLLAQYSKKFHCLEHCYTYHNISDEGMWRMWKEMCVPHSSEMSGHSQSISTEGKKVTLQVKEKDDIVNMKSNENKSSPMNEVKTDSQRQHFIYTIKANQFLTHTRMLAIDKEVEEHIIDFFGKRCPLLEDHLGPVLLQLPPQFHKNSENINRIKGIASRIPKTIRIAVEFRHRSWYCEEIHNLLRCVGWALVVAHHHNDPTGSIHIDTGVPFMYVRMHGATGLHVGDYGPDRLLEWAECIVNFIRGGGKGTAGEKEKREVFFFFNNSDSHIGGVTSSTVDATFLAEKVQTLLNSEKKTSTVVDNQMKDINSISNSDLASVDDVTVISD
ncbi:uncharacterized protein TM35_000022880 [Trypanosoma theileri]|uniref:Uncharacterized protein n=1 Tax=Trypanosoma theileri TaxID=67003 RepID=A0A1X0P7Q2_9TRYP|nr:uncharacterized protein TM35_000022880 [Trypanosoma theileri]ORC92962.1 hypothetical protein TM35_000022880 [Trypanosoma theileri]